MSHDIYFEGCTFEDFIRKYEPFQLVTTPSYQPSPLNPVDPQMTAMYYPAPPMPPVGQVQPYSVTYPNFFMFPNVTATPYSEGLISPPISYSIPDSNQPPTPASAPAQLSNDEIMVRAFEKCNSVWFTCIPTSDK